MQENYSTYSKRNALKKNSICIKSKSEVRRVIMSDVLYFEQELRKVNVHLPQNEYSVYGNIKNFDDNLPEDFFKCHRSYLINFQNVVAMKELTIFFSGGKTITLGRDKFTKAKKAFEVYLDDRTYNI